MHLIAVWQSRDFHPPIDFSLVVVKPVVIPNYFNGIYYKNIFNIQLKNIN